MNTREAARLVLEDECLQLMEDELNLDPEVFADWLEAAIQRGVERHKAKGLHAQPQEPWTLEDEAKLVLRERLETEKGTEDYLYCLAEPLGLESERWLHLWPQAVTALGFLAVQEGGQG